MFTTFDIVMTILVSAGLAFIFGRMWQRAVDNPVEDNRLQEDVEALRNCAESLGIKDPSKLTGLQILELIKNARTRIAQKP